MNKIKATDDRWDAMHTAIVSYYDKEKHDIILNVYYYYYYYLVIIISLHTTALLVEYSLDNIPGFVIKVWDVDI
jgi:hypothetical protein